MLTEKCKDYEAQLQEYESRDEQYQELEAESDLLRQQVESTRYETMIVFVSSYQNELLLNIPVTAMSVHNFSLSVQ